MIHAIIHNVGFIRSNCGRLSAQGRRPAHSAEPQYLVLALPNLMLIRL
jgi:hypothetical protein